MKCLKLLVCMLLMIPLIFGCTEVDLKETEEFKSFISQVDAEDEIYTNSELFKKLKYKKTFPECIINQMIQYEEANDLSSANKIVAALNYFEYENEEIKNQYKKCVDKAVKVLIENKSKEAIDEYFVSFAEFLDCGYYMETEYDNTIYVTRELIDYMCEISEVANCKNNKSGYYASHDPLKSEEEYWYDPLGKRRESHGEVGFMKVTNENEIYGDFWLFKQEKWFYGTSFSDYGNERIKELYYKNIPLANVDEVIDEIFDATKDGNAYYCDVNDDFGILFIIIPSEDSGENAIHYMYRIENVE